MFILIKGSGRQSAYMELIYQGTPLSVLFQFGVNYSMHISQKTYGIVERSDESRTDTTILQKELQGLMERILSEISCSTIFVHGDFRLSEVSTLMELSRANDERFTLIVSVLDESLPSGEIIIEEIKHEQG
ncbi:hypothetical protein GK047_09910 [Paenibacillus sp. SYP-B3998]|uniref:Uncharacterized protein n=1 Tax=Paenibacillus sp. SYP-B3998 TaxID=2678564 RepID=A0A6G3ZY44_9BACL|nr:hypothetical protein [Paenibacillus sp. SYP-B3998]NEW06327.1 hypothetical protein [Paenibacillus sp. SYP-B3998]